MDFKLLHVPRIVDGEIDGKGDIVKPLRDGWCLALLVCALMTAGAACSTVQKVYDRALGRGGKEAKELAHLQRVERAQTLTDAQVDRRLSYLIGALDDDHLHGALWQYGWMFIDAAGGASNVGFAATKDDHLAYYITRAVKGAIGVVYLLLVPQPLRNGAEPIRDMPSATRADKMTQLVAAEDLMAEAAERAHQPFSWGYHLGAIAFNGAAAGAVAAADTTTHAVESFVIDTAVSEVQVFTQPWWEPPKQWEEYERLVAEEEGHPVVTDHRVEWGVVPTAGGLALEARF